MTLLTGFDLCRAALAVTDISAPEQSVLMVLAIMANDQAQAWPAIGGPLGLTAKTKLSERAVQGAVKALVAAGHLTRLERAGRGVLYTVHPQLSPAMQPHYVYKITDPATGEFYIGSRTAPSGDPSRDGYMGSGAWFARRTSSGASLAKTVLATFGSRDEASAAERDLIATCISDSLCRNERTPAGGAPRTRCTPQEVRPAGGAPTPAGGAPKQPRTTNQPSGTRKRAPAVETYLPADFVPEAKPGSLTAKAMAEWPPGELEQQLEHFTDHHTAKRTKSADWQASWRTWVKNWKTFNGRSRHHQHRGSGNNRTTEMADAYRDLGFG